MSAMVKAVIWDMGGVLLRTEDQTPRKRLAERLGLDLKDLYWFVFTNETAQKAEVGQIPAEEHWEAIRTHFKLSEAEMEAFQEDFWGGDRMDMELINYIRGLKMNYKTALLSNAWSDASNMLSERFQVLDAFHHAVFSAEVGLAKPDPKIFHYVLDKISIPPEEAVFVDDLPHNVEAARRIGMHGVIFTSRTQVLDELAKFLA